MANSLGLDAYAGAVMFVAFLSEMRHPMDFWKGLLTAQLFITVVYVFFGAFVSFPRFKLVDDNRARLIISLDLPLLRPVQLQQRQPVCQA